MAINYDALGSIIEALNQIDQAQSEFPRDSEPWLALNSIYSQLMKVDISPAKEEEKSIFDVYATAYGLQAKFAYSLRCERCRNEVPHTQDEHDKLRGAA